MPKLGRTALVNWGESLTCKNFGLNQIRKEGTMENIIKDIIKTIKIDAPVRDVRIGPFWTAVWSRHCGLSSTVFEHEHSSGPPVPEAGHLTEKTALELCEYALAANLLKRSIGLAAINSLYEIDINSCQRLNAAELLLEHGRGKKVCVVGHFPFVPRLRQAAKTLWVLERRPRMYDLPAEQAEQVLPQADIVAITGTALLNGTMGELLALCKKDALIMVLGPTAPISPVWFEYGVSIVSGTRVTDAAMVLNMVSQGIIFSQFKGIGVDLLSLVKGDVVH